MDPPGELSVSCRATYPTTALGHRREGHRSPVLRTVLRRTRAQSEGAVRAGSGRPRGRSRSGSGRGADAQRVGSGQTSVADVTGRTVEAGPEPAMVTVCVP